jgi:hypothetical protein
VPTGVGRAGDLDVVDELAPAIGTVGVELDAVEVDTDKPLSSAALAEHLDLLARADRLGKGLERAGAGGRGRHGQHDEGGGHRQGHQGGWDSSHAILLWGTADEIVRARTEDGSLERWPVPLVSWFLSRNPQHHIVGPSSRQAFSCRITRSV